jgi:hypothetical protein
MQNIDLTEKLESKYSEFLELVKDVPYERKGILYSEMFFLWLSAEKINPTRVLESGRARGQSTLILSKIFPNSEVISVEHDKTSPDVAIAESRLANCANVRLLYGDATLILPELASTSTNDIALIDGPKGFRGLRLSFNLLSNHGIKQCYIHDTTFNTEERIFLDRYIASVNLQYSDEPSLAKTTHQLDIYADMEVPERFKYSPGKPYGFSLGCINQNNEINFKKLIFLSRVIQLLNRIKRKLGIPY